MKASVIHGVASGAWLLLFAATTEATVLYQVIDLGTANGSTRSEARGINRQGEVWGENFNVEYPYFIWRNGTNSGVAKPTEVSAMSLYGMNDIGQFVGFFSYSIPARNSVFLGLPARPQLSSVTNFSPRGVNLWGDIVGITSIKVEIYPGGPLALVNRPAVVKGRQMTILPALPGSNVWVNAEATAINDNGVIVGWSGTSNNVLHAFLWDGTMHDLHTLGTRTNSVASAINNNGMVAGNMYDYSIFREPFVWTSAGGMTALTLPGGYSTGQPLGLNNHGDVVGVASGGSSSAVLWTNGVMTDLQTVIPTSPAWDLDGAYGINDAGEICGYGKQGGLTTGILLRPTNSSPTQFNIELLDPGDPSETNALTGVRVTTNAAVLNTLSVRRVAVAADGAARLLVRASTTNHGTMALSLRAADGATGVTGNQNEDGGVGNLGGYGGFLLSRDTYETPTVSTAQGIRAYALYHAPDVLHRTGPGYDDSALYQRVINLQAVFTPNGGGGATTQSVAIAIFRPPVVLMHGVWSNPDDAFGGFMQKFKQEELGVQIFAPLYPNAISFASNAMEVPKAINNARVACREQNIACARADIFAHSMGGVLSRIHAGRADYNRAENYGLGDINRLVTIDSPHRGSIFGDAVKRTFNWLDTYGLTSVHGGIGLEMAILGMPPELGAGEDLLTTSVAISNMNQVATDVASHVIVGDYTFGVDLKSLPKPLGPFYTALEDAIPIPGVHLGSLFFAPVPGSDLIVNTNSQNADLTGNATTTYDHWHLNCANTINVEAKCLSLFRKPPSSDQYARGFPTGWVAPFPPPLPPPPVSVIQVIENTLILLFTDGLSVLSGLTVSASVSEPPGTNFISATLITHDATITDTNAPFDFSLAIPADAVGDYPVSYLATDTASNLWWGTQTLSVTPLASLNYLEAAPRRFAFNRLDDREQIVVTGVYFDRPRNVTAPSTGTTYSSADTNMVSVNTNGVMIANGAGATQITISKSGKNAFVDVVVSPSPAPDLALGQTASVSSADVGAPVTFTLGVTNVGPQTAMAGYLADALPVDVQFQSATTSQGAWSFTNGLFSVELGTLAPGSNATATVSVAFTNGGTHLSRATVSATGLDVNSSDNLAAATVNITIPLVLNLRFDGTNVLLTWPTTAAGYQLEDTTNLVSPGTWNLTSTNPPSTGGEYQFSVPPTNAARYFRLHHP